MKDFRNGTKNNTVVGIDGISLAIEKNLPYNWTQVSSEQLGKRANAAFDYDSLNGEFVLFGGEPENYVLGETWTYNSTTDLWVNKNRGARWEGPISAIYNEIQSENMVFDRANGEMVLFNFRAGQIWAYNLSLNKWTKRDLLDSPSLRSSYATTYDSKRDEIILFGGNALYTGDVYNDTWTYNLTNNSWTNKTPAASPPPTTEHDIVYDSENDVIILYAGTSGETWTYDPNTNNWTQMNPSISPPPRYFPKMVYCPSIKSTLLFGGGYAEYKILYNDTWIYDCTNDTWTEMTPSDAPSPRTQHVMVYDEKKSEVILVGGYVATSGPLGYGSNAEMWRYNFTTNSWNQRMPGTPPPRTLHGMVSDTNNEKMILFGGRDSSGHDWLERSMFNDTWTYNLSIDQWVNMEPANAPSQRSSFSMAFDRLRGEVVLFGGESGNMNASIIPMNLQSDTWTYNLTTNIWTNKTPINAPTPRYGSAMVYNTKNGEMILFGGRDASGEQNDTWTYNLTTNKWTKKSPVDAPSPRSYHGMTFIETSGEAFLYGGLIGDWSGGGYIDIYLVETWKYNSTADKWTNITTAYEPSIRFTPGITYDSFRNEIILFSGILSYSDILPYDTWIFNVSKNRWVKIETSISPPPVRLGSSLTYDSRLKESVLFGGQISTGNYPFVDGHWYGDTWAFHHRSYYEAGNYTSLPNNTNSSANFETIFWNASTSNYTGLRFQFRSDDTNASMQMKDFIGPDGTSTSYYYTSGQQINGTMHNGSQWFQYKAYLNTSAQSLTPILKNVTINYNILPEMPNLGVPSPGNWTNNSKPSFTWIFSDKDSTVGGFQWEMDNSSIFDSVDFDSGQVSSTDLSYIPDNPIPDGTWYWRVRTLDSDGDWGPFSDSRVLRMDTRPPEPFQPVADPPGWTNRTIQLIFNTTDSGVGLSHYEVEIDGDSQGTQTSPFTLPILSDGEHNITVKAYDLLWNSISAVVKAYSDQTPPLAFIPTAQPSGWTNSSPLIFFNTSDEASGITNYEIGLDGAAFSPHTSPYQLQNLTEGQHNVTVRAHDAAGNYRDAIISIYLDKTRPFNFTIVNDIPTWTNKNSNITFTALDGLSEIDHYEVKLPGENFTPQTSPYRLPDLPDGRYNITIRAYDKALNFAETVFEVLIDETPPAHFTPTANPAVWTNKDPTITYSTIDNTSGVSRYEVKIDNGNFTIRPSPFLIVNLSDGQRQAVVRAYDAAGNYVEGTTIIYFDKTPPAQLSLNINNGAKSSGKRTVTLTIEASDAASGIDSFCFSDNGTNYSSWESFTTTRDWNLSKGQGSKTIYLKVKDKAGNEATAVSASITYSPVQAGNQLNTILLLLALLILIGAAIGVWRWRASKKPIEEVPPPKEEVATPEPEEEEALPPEPAQKPETVVPKEEPVVAKLAVVKEKAVLPVAPALAAPKQSGPKPVETPKVIAPVSAPATKAPPPTVTPKAARPPVAPKIPVAPAIATPPEGFAVEDIFLMYQDGRLIQHTTRRLKADMDVDIMTSMLKAVQEFVKESIGLEAGAELGSMEYGENKILFEKGRNTILASVITGKEPEGFRDEMKGAVMNIESEFASVLPTWDGTTNKLAGAKRFLAQLGTFAPAIVTPSGKPSGEVSLKAELEFYQGFVRLKVAVKNSTPTAIMRAALKVIFNEKAFRLDHIEPDFERRGEELILGIVEPGEKQTVAIYLDPQICTESYIEGILSFKNAQGNLNTMMMPRKLASVVCPILYTEENINTAMLKRMAVEELDKKDSKVFTIPSGITPQKAFEIGKAAIQHHDLRHVREFVEKEPYIAEAWYYGKAKGREDRLVIRTRVLSEQQVLEFHVASTSTLMLTGMLAELKSDLNDELNLKQVKGKMEQVTDARKVDALGGIMSLLEKAPNSEIDAGDTEAR